jgi:phosphonate transport system permease protein
MSIASVETEFRNAQTTRRWSTAVALAALCIALLVSASISEAYPRSLIEGLPRVGEYFDRLLPKLDAEHFFAGYKTEGALAYWFYRLPKWAWLLFETSQMALLATMFGGIVAFFGCFFASANLVPSKVVYFAARRILELFRTVPDIVYALILVWAFGIGPVAGIFAIALHTVGALGKQFAEAIENADMKPWDAVRAAGGNWVQSIRFAILPQVLPNLLSYFLLRFEINVRGATVIGFVGAGGIGQELYEVISFNYYEEISAIVVLIILAVSVIDMISEQLRRMAIGRVTA